MVYGSTWWEPDEGVHLMTIEDSSPIYHPFSLEKQSFLRETFAPNLI
jgi:hypothetical protein